MRSRAVLFLLFALIFACNSDTIFAQKKLFAAYKKVNRFLNGSYDTAYIKRNPVDFVLVLKSINYMDGYTIKNSEHNTFVLQSDLCYNVGASFGYKNFVLGYSYNISNLIYPNSIKSSNLTFNLPTNLFSLELSYFRNQGRKNLIQYRTRDSIINTRYAFEGLEANILTADAFYFVNHKRYANNSAYSTTFGCKQQKSAGSVITGLAYTRQNLHFDYDLLPVDNQFNLPVFENAYSTYSMHAGYGYNFVFQTHWLANISIITTTGVRVNAQDKSTDFNFATKSKMALAYNQPLFFVGINCNYGTNYSTLSNSLGNFNLYFGYRFLTKKTKALQA